MAHSSRTTATADRASSRHGQHVVRCRAAYTTTVLGPLARGTSPLRRAPPHGSYTGSPAAAAAPLLSPPSPRAPRRCCRRDTLSRREFTPLSMTPSPRALPAPDPPSGRGRIHLRRGQIRPAVTIPIAISIPAAVGPHHPAQLAIPRCRLPRRQPPPRQIRPERSGSGGHRRRRPGRLPRSPEHGPADEKRVPPAPSLRPHGFVGGRSGGGEAEEGGGEDGAAGACNTRYVNTSMIHSRFNSLFGAIRIARRKNTDPI